MACCLPTCAQGLSVPVAENFGFGVFWAFWFLSGVLCIWGVLALLASLSCTKLGVGGGITFVTSGENAWQLIKLPVSFLGFLGDFKPYMLSSAGQSSLHGSGACVVYWVKEAFRRSCRLKYGETSFSPFWVFLLSRNSRARFWGLLLWHLWIGKARHPGPAPPSQHFGLEVFNVGGWLTHGDLALEDRVDFLAVVEHRLIPARVRSEWDRLKRKGLASVWAPACQDSSHVGNAGVGVICMRGAPVALNTFATAQFKRFFDCGRAVRCLLPLGAGRFMHLVVLYGYQGADTDAEQLALTEQLFDAALGELSVVAQEQPCMIVGDFKVEPTKIPCLA